MTHDVTVAKSSLTCTCGKAFGPIDPWPGLKAAVAMWGREDSAHLMDWYAEQNATV